MRSADEQAIRQIIANYEMAWNTHDMQAMAQLYSDDAEWVNVVGMYWRGREAVVKAHTAFHTTMFKDNEIHSKELTIHDIHANMSIAVWTILHDAYTTPDGVRIPESRNRLTIVLANRQGQWLITHGHNTLIDENAARFDPVNT